jgi:hypothetical protein
MPTHMFVFIILKRMRDKFPPVTSYPTAYLMRGQYHQNMLSHSVGRKKKKRSTA